MPIGSYLGKGAKYYQVMFADNTTAQIYGLLAQHGERHGFGSVVHTQQITLISDRVTVGDIITVGAKEYYLNEGISAQPAIGLGHKIFNLKEKTDV